MNKDEVKAKILDLQVEINERIKNEKVEGTLDAGINAKLKQLHNLYRFLLEE